MTNKEMAMEIREIAESLHEAIKTLQDRGFMIRFPYKINSQDMYNCPLLPGHVDFRAENMTMTRDCTEKL